MGGNMHGKGVYTYANGAKFEGDYADNKRHGTGVFTYADGTVRLGEWSQGV